MEFLRKKEWRLPKPSIDGVLEFDIVSQDKFFKEYHPTSHRIFDQSWYNDIEMRGIDNEPVGWHKVSRVAVAWQAMSVDIILSHLLGNKTYLSDSKLKGNPSLSLYREYWDMRNIDVARYEFCKNDLSLGDSALIFYRKNGELKYQSLSMFNMDEYYMEYDKYREPYRFFKYYDDKCDVYTDKDVSTYIRRDDKKWELVKSESHGFKGMPVVYKKRHQGAFWTNVQTNIETVEKMLSRLSEDNRTKFKSLYALKTDNPKDVQTASAGMMDMVITDTDGDFKLIQSADISTQFKFEYDTQKEIIYDSLGIVFPKHKSSGDMPTGSMKMMFYPTERVVISLINEYDKYIDAINEIVKQGFVTEFPDDYDNILKGNIKASIRLFTPQDDTTKNESISKLLSAGVISEETAAEECTIAANNEIARKQKEKEAEIDDERKRANLRLPYDYGD